jgi:hypothetical protein
MKTNLDKLDALIAQLPDNGPPRGEEFTVAEYMKRRSFPDNPTGKQAAYRELDAFLEAGKITVRKGLVGKREGNIYAPTK